MRYSYVFQYPDKSPFDRPESRLPSFVGEFIAPLLKRRPHILYWFAHYGNYVKFRIHPNDHAEIEAELKFLRESLGLTEPKNEKEREEDLTIEGDLGCGRFWDDKSQYSQQERIIAILRSLKAVSDLMINSVRKREDGYWEVENSEDLNNPICGHLFSVTHLYHAITGADGIVWSFDDEAKERQVLSHYYYSNLDNNSKQRLANVRCHQIKF